MLKRLIFLNRYFYPDQSATSQILSDLAFYAAHRGREVDVITSQQRYEDSEAGLPASETVRGVRIHRVSTTRFGRSNLLGRGFDYMSFYIAMWRKLRTVESSNAIVITKTDPPLLSTIVRSAAPPARHVNWLQDLYPEVAIQLGVPLLKGPIGFGLSYLRNASLKSAAANIVVGERMAENIRALGIDNVNVIPNWSHDEEIVPVAQVDNPLRQSWGLEEKFVVAYSGNLGRAHEYETVLAAAEKLRGNSRLVFIFIGGGHRMRELAQRVEARGLDEMFRFFGYQPQAQLKYSLGVAQVHWISLRPALEGLIVPSKFYGIAAAGRAIVAIMKQDGEIGGLVRRYKCGIVIDPGDAAGLAAALNKLAGEPQLAAEMGMRARAMLDANFTRSQGFDRWLQILNGIG